jgi:hypothetical protein
MSSQPRAVIARSAATKQSRSNELHLARDCFASLAMTVLGSTAGIATLGPDFDAIVAVLQCAATLGMIKPDLT